MAPSSKSEPLTDPGPYLPPYPFARVCGTIPRDALLFHAPALLMHVCLDHDHLWDMPVSEPTIIGYIHRAIMPTQHRLHLLGWPANSTTTGHKLWHLSYLRIPSSSRELGRHLRSAVFSFDTGKDRKKMKTRPEYISAG